VAAAGNEGLNLSAAGVNEYPCEIAAANVICVGATDQTDTLAGFSNFGADAVDLAAPGVNILSTLAEPDTVFSEGFEGNIGATWTTGGTHNTWARTNERARTGSFSLADSPGGSYVNDTNSFARLTNAVSLAGRTDCTLAYELLLAFQPPDDGVVIEVSPNGVDWVPVDGWTGSSNGAFLPLEVPLGGLANVYVRFRVTSDAAGTDDGVHVDDVRVLCPALTYDAADLEFLDGTSMATPQVTGTLALMMADTPGVSVAELRQRLLANVDALPSLAGRTVTGGRVNAAKAVGSAPPPVVVTQPATAISQTGATLNGTVNPRGHATNYRFEYGTTTSYGASTPVTDAGAGDGVAAVSAALTGLAPNTTYHYRLVATHSDGSVSGGDAQFTTLPLPPVVVSQPATLITTTTAVLQGTVNPNGGATTYHFEWGPTTDYGNSTPAANAGAGTGQVTVSAPLSLLLPDTTYHFRLVATNSGGTAVSGDAQFATAPVGPPVVAIAAPTMVLRISATLHGTVDPAGKSTQYRFQYGTTTSYGTSTPPDDAGAGTGPVPVSAAISPLAPGTTYHFRLVATNADGTTVSADATFTTPAVGPPVVALAAPTQVTKRTATLNGTVDPRGVTTAYHFEYGLTESYGTSTPAGNADPGSGEVAVSADLTGLEPGTEYHYRLVATNDDGTTLGADTPFTTASLTRPVVTAEAATPVGKRTATLNATLNPNNLDTTYHFEYGLTTAYGDTTPAANATANSGASPVSAALTGLAPNTTYHFRLVATNDDGSTLGDDGQFTTSALTPPDVFSGPTTSITPTGAKVSGTVNPHGVATTYHFEYGTTTGYGASTPAANAGFGTVGLAVSAALGNLAPATKYHVRLVAASADGTAHSTDGTFTTPPRPRPPQVSTGAAAGLSQTAATIAATVNPNGQATTYAFQYGRTTAYGARTPTRSAGAGRAAVAVRAALSGLQPRTTYHYRVVATNPTGAVAGADRVFTTAAPPPAPPAPAPIALVAPRTLRLDRRGAVSVRVVCPAGRPPSTGLAELFRGRAPATATRWLSLDPAFAALARAPKRIGAKSFATKPGATVRVRIRLTRAGRRLVAHRASVPATVRVTVLTQVATKQVRLKRRRR
jgi:phosphodiesterase/alkaline phosphatase D-like protein